MSSMASIGSFRDMEKFALTLFGRPPVQRDGIVLLQENKKETAIFVDVSGTGRSRKIWQDRYFTQESFKHRFGVDFEEVLMNYFKIYAEKHGLDVSFDDNLISLIQLMKFMIKNRDKDPEDWKFVKEFTATCETPYTSHLTATHTDPFQVLALGPGFQTPKDPTYTYVKIRDFVFSQRETVYRVYFRY